MSNVKRSDAPFVAVMVIIVAGLVYGMFMLATDKDFHSMKPCQYEDSTSCFWDATNQGNGHGRSFYSDANGNVTYVESGR